MKRVAIITAGVAVLALVQDAGAAPRLASGVTMPAQDVVQARRAAMMMSGSALGTLKAQANAEDLKRAGFPARALNAWAKAIPGMFPPDTNVAPTEALPAVWTDRAGFEAAAQSFAAATDAAGKAAAANDKAAYTAGLDQVGKACSACHDKYRKPDEKR